MACAADRGASDAARRAARRPHLRHAADARGARRAVRKRDVGHTDVTDARRCSTRFGCFSAPRSFASHVADRLGSLPLMKVSDRLTDTAELVLEFALRTAWRELAAKHGTPSVRTAAARGGLRRDRLRQARRARARLRLRSRPRVPARLDGARNRKRTARRRSTTSVSSAVSCSGSFTSSRFRRARDACTRSTRGLRPSGRAGLLVTSLDGFRRYQTQDAWVWEHQALAP